MSISKYSRAYALLAGVSMLAMASSAHAGTVSIADSYYGGLNTYNNNGAPPNLQADIIGNADFQIYGTDITRTGNNLEVKLYTNFVQHVGEDSVGLGALFLRNGVMTASDFNTAGAGANPGGTMTGPPTYSQDEAKADPSRFQYAVQLPNSLYAPAINTSTGVSQVGNSGGATVYGLVGNGTDVDYSHVLSGYQTVGNGGSSFYFREGQAVGVKPQSDTINMGAASYSVGTGLWSGNPTGTLTFDIANAFVAGGGFLQDSFTLAWAMTCANDVIYAATTLNANRPTPLPAALPMMAGGLGIIGLVARKRRKKNAAPAQA